MSMREHFPDGDEGDAAFTLFLRRLLGHPHVCHWYCKHEGERRPTEVLAEIEDAIAVEEA